MLRSTGPLFSAMGELASLPLSRSMANPSSFGDVGGVLMGIELLIDLAEKGFNATGLAGVFFRFGSTSILESSRVGDLWMMSPSSNSSSTDTFCTLTGRSGDLVVRDGLEISFRGEKIGALDSAVLGGTPEGSRADEVVGINFLGGLVAGTPFTVG